VSWEERAASAGTCGKRERASAGTRRWRARTAGVPQTNPCGSVAGRGFGKDPLKSDRVVLHLGDAQPKHAPLGPPPRVLADRSMSYPELRLVVRRES
jgi:hypothetical protein